MFNECDLIVIKIEPMGKPRLTRADAWRQRATVSHWYAYKDELKARLFGYQLPPRLEIEFYLRMPRSWSQKTRKSMAGQPHRQKPDIDNLAKGFMDALSDDDAHVWELSARKFWKGEGMIVVYGP